MGGQTILPDKGLRLVVGFAAGGGTDLMARLMAPRLELRLGRRMTVENRPGGTGALVGETLKKGPADGSLLGFMPSPTLASKLAASMFPFDPQADVAPVSLAGTFQLAIAVSSTIGVSTFADYAKWVKGGEPERARFGTATTDTFQQLISMMLGREVGTPIQHVGYRGNGPLVDDLASGKLPAGAGTVPFLLQHHRSGRLKILATSGRKPVAVAPQLPTAAALGHPRLEMDEFYGFFAPPGTSAAVIEEWNRQIAGMLANGAIAGELAALGLDVESSTPQELASRVASNLEAWKSRMDFFGIKPTN